MHVEDEHPQIGKGRQQAESPCVRRPPPRTPAAPTRRECRLMAADRAGGRPSLQPRSGRSKCTKPDGPGRQLLQTATAKVAACNP